MKKNNVKLGIRKNTIAALGSKAQDMIRGGFRAVTSESCPGDQCPTKKKSCDGGGICDDLQAP
ncbi:MAG: hypothetical protein AAF617_01205 [Bacteroidota bacterium]